MKKILRILMVCAALTVSVSAQLQNFGDITVKVEAMHAARVGTGYVEHRATLVNHSRVEPHQVTLIFHTFWRGSAYEVYNSEQTRRTVELAPGATATVLALQPRHGRRLPNQH